MFEFLSKGAYTSCIDIFPTMLRSDKIFEIPFRLYHKSLRAKDKHYILGQTSYECKI